MLKKSSMILCMAAALMAITSCSKTTEFSLAPAKEDPVVGRLAGTVELVNGLYKIGEGSDNISVTVRATENLPENNPTDLLFGVSILDEAGKDILTIAPAPGNISDAEAKAFYGLSANKECTLTFNNTKVGVATPENAKYVRLLIARKSLMPNGDYVCHGNFDGKYPFTMNFTISDQSKLEGTYYYDKYGPGNKLSICGELDPYFDTLMIEESVGYETTGNFTGKINGEVFTGEFCAASNGKIRPFEIEYKLQK